jgi:Tol biopolymer transport system component
VDDFSPAVSPDGRELAFHSWRSGSRDIYVLPLGGGPEQEVVASPRQESRAEWAPDGRALVHLLFGTGGIWVVRRDADGHWGAPVERSAFGSWASWSPDGRWIAFAERQAGGSLLVMRADSGAPRVLVDNRSTGRTAEEPQWSGDGKSIYFKGHDARGRAEFWAEPLAGGRPQLLIRFDDLSRPSLRPEWSIGGGRMYFTVNDRQSDIWVMEATPQ